MRSFRLPLVASILGHGGVLALLALFAAQLPPIPLPEQRKEAIEVMLAAPQPVAEAPRPEPEPPPAAVEPPPPEPPPPPVATPKPEPAPPPPKPVVHKPIVKPRPLPQPVREVPPEAPPVPMQRAMPQTAPVQTAAIPVPHPVPTVSANYRALLSAWLESHKRYPDSARERGEEGRAQLRFRVDHFGRVLNYAVVSSSGYADLDAGIEAMMHGAILPPFPADMTASDVEVSVTVRFSLTR